jgi:uncharacterized membrane protein
MKFRRVRRLIASGWFIPMAYTFVSLVVGVTFPRVEHFYLPDLVSTMSAASAMSVCSAIASGMIALTGIVFSLTFVMVQFSATAYSPRLVVWVSRDPVVSHALGVFISTFLYALIMLAWVDRNVTGRVPFISSWMVVVMLVASMAMFIALIERITLLQINRMLIFTGNQGRKSIDQLYPEPGSVHPEGAAINYERKTPIQTIAYAGGPGVVQSIRIRSLVELAARSGAVIEVLVTVGDAVVEMTPLLRVFESPNPLDETALRDAIAIGDERTFEQDPKFAIRIIVDIAIKALSPAINDPTTAVQALDQIEDLLLRLGHRFLGIGSFEDRDGRLRLIVPFPTWNDFLQLSLTEIRQYGADSVQVLRRMKALIRNLQSVLPPERHPALQNWEQSLNDTIARSFPEMEHRIAASVADRQGLGHGHAPPQPAEAHA